MKNKQIKISPPLGHLTIRLRSIALLIPVIVTTGCSAIKPSSNSVYMVSGAGEGILESKMHSPKHYKTLGSGYEMVESVYPESYYISSNHVYSKFRCKVDPSHKSISDVHVVYGKNSPADNFSEVPNNYEGFKIGSDKPTPQEMIDQLRQKCLTASVAEAESFKFDAVVREKLAKKAKVKREADRKNREETKKYQSNNIYYLVHAYREENELPWKGKFKYIPKPVNFKQIMYSVQNEDLTKGTYIQLSTWADYGYKVNQPTGSGYRLTLVDPYDRYKERVNHLPVLLKTKAELVVGNHAEGRVRLMRYEGLQSYTTITVSLAQAAVFTDLNVAEL